VGRAAQMGRFLVWLGVTGFWAVGCGPRVPVVPEGTPVSYAAHLEPLVLARCLGCHNADEAKARLDLEQGKGYGNLVGRPSTQVPSMPLVKPGSPEDSYLWLKLQHTTERGEGMPRTLIGARKLRADELELYRRWIEDGALP
jgi:hypothetical protein